MQKIDRKSNLESVIATAIDSSLKNIHTVLPGKIIEFYASEQLADIQPAIKRNINGELINLPVLTKVPVRFLKSGDFTITFPLKKDDEIALYFVERSIDNWLQNGDIQSPDDYRKFDLSDAYAVPVLYSQKNKISDFDEENLVIKSTNGNSKIVLKKDGNISIETKANTEIKSAKTIINNDLEVVGTVKAQAVEATNSLQISGVEVGRHSHGGVQSGGANTAPMI